ncbi:MAG: hypothetical protein LBH43_08400, partial [Treponema sp.]|nr:hypothetical protein [Treponema sp.]
MVNKKTWSGILAMALVFGMTIIGCDDGNGKKPVPPENWPVADRWFSWVDDTSTATLDCSVDDDGVVTITVGGTAEVETWNAWKANCQYQYTAIKGKFYDFEFEAWTESGVRVLDIQYYYEEGGEDLVFEPNLQITNQRRTYTLRNETAIPKGGVRNLSFRCANQTGKFYVKVISIKETPTLEGTWVYEDDEDGEDALRFNNDGTFNVFIGSGMTLPQIEGISIYTSGSFDGTYTTNGNNLTFHYPRIGVTVTYFVLINAEQHILEGDRRDFDNCTREQFIQKVRTALVELEAP